MRIGIIGSGALGLLCSSYLSRNHTVTLYVRREEQLRALQAKPITLEVKGTSGRQSENVTFKLMTELGEEDCFLVAVKQAGIASVLQQLTGIKNTVPTVFMQNGMGHLDAIQTINAPSYLGIVQHGAVRETDLAVHHLGLGMIKLAPVSGTVQEAKKIVEQLDRPDFPFQLEKNWEQLVKEKLIVNAVINPLTALFDVKNKAIIENKHIRNIAIKLCEESARALKIDGELAWHLVGTVAASTGENTSSMRADRLQGKQTEIEAISGYILKQNEDPMPYTRFVYEAILGLEREGET